LQERSTSGSSEVIWGNQYEYHYH